MEGSISSLVCCLFFKLLPVWSWTRSHHTAPTPSPPPKLLALYPLQVQIFDIVSKIRFTQPYFQRRSKALSLFGKRKVNYVNDEEALERYFTVCNAHTKCFKAVLLCIFILVFTLHCIVAHFSIVAQFECQIVFLWQRFARLASQPV